MFALRKTISYITHKSSPMIDPVLFKHIKLFLHSVVSHHPLTLLTEPIIFYSILFISDIVKATWYQTGFGTHIMAQQQIYLSLLALAASHTYCSNSTHLKVHHSPLGPLLIKMSHYKTSAWLPGRLVFSLFSSSFLLPMALVRKLALSSSTPLGSLPSRRSE